MVTKTVMLTTVNLKHSTLESAIKELCGLQEEYKEFSNIRFDYGYCYDYDPNKYLFIKGDRPETQDEEDERKEIERKMEEFDLLNKKEEYLRLKELFEKG